MLGNIGVFSLVRSWKLFFDLLSQCNFTLDLAFCAFLNISKTARQGGETKGPHHIHSLRSSCFIKKSAFNVAGNLVMVVKFTFQSVFGNSLQNPRHFSARGREESLELYSILWSDRPTSKQKVLRHGKSFCCSGSQTLFFGGREATTGNSSAVRRLGWDRKIRYCPLFGNRVLGVRVIRREQNSMWTLTPS